MHNLSVTWIGYYEQTLFVKANISILNIFRSPGWSPFCAAPVRHTVQATQIRTTSVVLECQHQCTLLELCTSILISICCAGESAPREVLNAVDAESMSASNAQAPGQEEGGTQDEGNLQPGHKSVVAHDSDSHSDAALASQPQSAENDEPASAPAAASPPPASPTEAPPPEAPPPECGSPAALPGEPGPAVDKDLVDEPASATAAAPDREPSPCANFNVLSIRLY